MGKKEPTQIPRQKAAELRAQAEAESKRRERLTRFAGGGIVGLIVVGIIGAAIIVPRMSGDASNAGGVVGPDASAPAPRGTLGPDSPYPYAVPVGTASADAPVLELWEDFQCPGCGALEAANGKGMQELANTGKVQLLYRPTTFLDRNLGSTSSQDATAAWGCAIDADKTLAYHDQIFANQPTREGEGWTQEQLLSFGRAAGIEGPAYDTFAACVSDGTYKAWAANSTEQFYADGITGTPSGILNGVAMDNAQLADQEALTRLVEAAATQ